MELMLFPILHLMKEQDIALKLKEAKAFFS